MVRQRRIVAGAETPVLLRLAEPELGELIALVCQRYPMWEWATFARFGWRETPAGLVLTLAGIAAPETGDLDENVGHVAIDEAYSLRMALSAEHSPLAIGVIHSHPVGCAPMPSTIDDDMDGYYARYFADFAPDRPYVSLIVSEIDGHSVISGRVHWRNHWSVVSRMLAPSHSIVRWRSVHAERPGKRRERTARLAAAFGDEAEHRLRSATVAVVGAGGTGSAAIEVLVRAGVGNLIIVDPDVLEESNLERVHGSVPGDAKGDRSKAVVARRHAKQIDGSCRVTAIVGSLPQKEVVDAIVTADVVVGCTDQQHSRLALGDMSLRYLVPAIDSGVTLEGRDGKVRGQIIQLVRMLPADPCPLCRDMVTPIRLAQELMSPEEQVRRKKAAFMAAERGEERDPYWKDIPQLNTVGYLTTTAGALAAGYAIGWLTGRFSPPFARLQMNIAAPYFDVTDVDTEARPDCVCRRVRGWADQGNADALISPPPHWPAPHIVA